MGCWGGSPVDGQQFAVGTKWLFAGNIGGTFAFLDSRLLQKPFALAESLFIDN